MHVTVEMIITHPQGGSQVLGIWSLQNDICLVLAGMVRKRKRVKVKEWQGRFTHIANGHCHQTPLIDRGARKKAI